MQFHYTLDAKDVLNPAKFEALKILLQEAGVTDIWLMGYFMGRFHTPIEDLVKAREIIIKNGFNTGITSLPVGHPGNALNPEDNEINLEIPAHWRYRIDDIGEKVYFCADIEENMINDNLGALETFIKAGFNRCFFDDDLRQGNWGSKIQGCFCDNCIELFGRIHPQYKNITRNEFHQAINAKSKAKNKELLKAWVEYSSQKLTHFMIRMNQIKYLEEFREGNAGIMVMQYGDERHGINLTELIREIPELQVRIGENHFNDRSMSRPDQRMDEFLGMLLHLNYIPLKNAYSETTVFPPRTLTPENWVFKAKLAAMLGVPNLFLMGGTWLIEDSYWKTLAQNKEQILDLFAKSHHLGINWPIDMEIGTVFDPIQIPAFLTASGIPVRPIRLDKEDQEDSATKVLIILHKIPFLEKIVKKIQKYSHIMTTKQIYSQIKDFLHHSEIKQIKITFLPNFNWFGIYQRKIKQICREAQIPHLTSGKDVAVIPFRSSEKIGLISFSNQDQKCGIAWNAKKETIVLPAYDFWIGSLSTPNNKS